jgi:hypothetical protein
MYQSRRAKFKACVLAALPTPVQRAATWNPSTALTHLHARSNNDFDAFCTYHVDAFMLYHHHVAKPCAAEYEGEERGVALAVC